MTASINLVQNIQVIHTVPDYLDNACNFFFLDFSFSTEKPLEQYWCPASSFCMLAINKNDTFLFINLQPLT